MYEDVNEIVLDLQLASELLEYKINNKIFKANS